MFTALRSCRLPAGLLAVGALLLAIRVTGVPTPELVENRRLAELPPLRDLVLDFGAWRSGVDAWLGDHFPARRHLIGGLNFLRYKLGYSGTSRVIVGRQGWLFYDDGLHLSQVRPSTLGEADVHAWVQEFKTRSELLHAEGIPYLVLAAPVKESLYRECVPAYLVAPGFTDAQVLAAAADRAGVHNYLDLHPALRAAKAAGQKIYSPYDTHWTSEGAYEGYTQLVQTLASRGVLVKAQPRDAFRAPEAGSVPVPEDLAFMLGIASFVRQQYPQLVADGPPSRVTWLAAGRDWTADRVIDTGVPGPVLLLTGDSFSNAWLPLLERSFSRIIFSHHQNGFFRPELVQRFRPDAVVLEVIESGIRHAMPARPSAASLALQQRS